MRCPLLFPPLVLASIATAQQPGHWWWFYSDSLQQYHYETGDEFNGRALDRKFWMTSGEGRRNHHGKHMLEYNSDGKNALLGDGTLRIQLRREEVTARGVEYEADTARLGDGGPNLRTWNYTSTLLVSNQHFQYGVFEARIKLPTGKGAWPSFWLYGGNPNEEIDILEGKGERLDQFHVDVHCPGDACDNYRNPIGAFGRWLGINWKGFGHWKTANGDLTAAFNDYVGEWTPGALRFYLNGEQCAEWNGGLHVPERLILQNALANTCKGCPFGPGPDDTTTFGEMVVDHVRVWKLMHPGDPALTIISGDGVPRDLTVEVSMRYAEAPATLEPKGGKRGKVRDVFRVKTLHDGAKRIVILEVTGEIPKEAYIDLQDPEGATLLKRRTLQRGIYTFTFAPGAGNIVDVLVGDRERSAVERVVLN
ncbi:MAG: glycoside hydrolase family 16 protein [Flavobacteriales bacterium]|nr:MAG: glycoside hydrolase family 16 protein [Flavobacteriales bacterium]